MRKTLSSTVEYQKVFKISDRYRHHNPKSTVFILALIGLFFGLTAVGLSIANILIPGNEYQTLFKVTWAKLWFGMFHYFTVQGNTLTIIFYLMWLTLFKTWIFRKRNFNLAICLYMNIIMTVYWVVMFPQWITGGMFDTSVIGIISTIIFHLVCPLIMNVFTFLGVNYPYHEKNPINRIYSNHFVYACLIYVILYAIYCVTINFIPLPINCYRDDQQTIVHLSNMNYITVYGSLTNFNPNCPNAIYVSGKLMIDIESKGSMINATNGFAVIAVYVFFYILITRLNNKLSTPKMMIQKLKELKNNHWDEYQKLVINYAKECQKQ